MVEDSTMRSHSKLRRKLCKKYLKGVPKRDKALLEEAFCAKFDEAVNGVGESISEHDGRTGGLEQLFMDKSSMSVDAKKRWLLEDPQMTELERISRELFEKARDKRNDPMRSLTSEQVSTYVARLERIYAGVQDFNRSKAEQEYSEALLDVRYVSEATSQEASVRLGRLIGRMEERESRRQRAAESESPQPAPCASLELEEEYEKIKASFCDTFLEGVPESETGLMRDVFLGYFDRKHKAGIVSDLCMGKARRRSFLEIQMSIACGKDLDAKKRFLGFRDFNCEHLFQISGELWKMASMKMSGAPIAMTKAEMELYEEELMGAFEGIESFNVRQARRSLSEALLDLKYIYDDDAQCVSFRLSHEMMRERSAASLG